MKKFCATFLIALAIIFCSQNNFAEAYNVNMGIYPESGLRGYLMTESIQIDRNSFHCTVVCYPNNRPYYIDYYFYQGGNGFYCRNSDGYTFQLSAYNTPVEFNVYRYVWLGYR